MENFTLNVSVAVASKIEKEKLIKLNENIKLINYNEILGYFIISQ